MKKFIFAFICILLIFSLIFFVPFKINYKNIINAECEKYGLDENLVYAIIKTESGFDTKAQSSAGAVGLMQILPSTANWVCDKLKINYTDYILLDPEINIKIGCYYFYYLLNLFDNNLENSICAYNAGQYTVINWLNNKEYSSDGKKLDKIPYTETKNYLKKIKFNKFVYSYFIIR